MSESPVPGEPSPSPSPFPVVLHSSPGDAAAVVTLSEIPPQQQEQHQQQQEGLPDADRPSLLNRPVPPQLMQQISWSQPIHEPLKTGDAGGQQHAEGHPNGKHMRPRDASSMDADHASARVLFDQLSWHVRLPASTHHVKGAPPPPTEKAVLKNVSGSFLPGRFSAVMGSSGSGKTSLLNVLAGYSAAGRVTGRMTVNGISLSAESMRELSAFVHQDDIILPSMTVREAVTFAAFLRLPDSMSATEKHARVDEVLRWLSLTHVALNVIGSVTRKGISGGERRRVSIAMELVRNPPLLFADEPTSGLDSYTAFQCASILRDIARKHHRTIVATLHQPSSEIFELLDDLILLDAGQVVYAGTAKGAIPYFDRCFKLRPPPHTNPADFIFMHVLNASEEEAAGFATIEKQNALEAHDDANGTAALTVPIANIAPMLRASSRSPGALDAPVQITYRNLNFSVQVEEPVPKAQGGGKKIVTRQVLKSCSGVFRAGKLTAIMGSSGAGKTSLLNLVSGFPLNGSRSGSLFLNDSVVDLESMGRMRELSAYIQQDDRLTASMTVREAVMMSAQLRLPRHMSLQEKAARVQSVLNELGLTRCADTLIGGPSIKGISGGEKRRTSMAVELIKAPSIIYLDEPTSGLDTYTAYSIMRMLKKASRAGRTVVATLHQPSSDIFRLFDDFVLLAHGRVMYHGEAAGVVPYFTKLGYPCPAHYNVSDHLFMSVVANMKASLSLIEVQMDEEIRISRASSLLQLSRAQSNRAVTAKEKEAALESIQIENMPPSAGGSAGVGSNFAAAFNNAAAPTANGNSDEPQFIINDDAAIAARAAKYAEEFDRLTRSESDRIGALLDAWDSSQENKALLHSTEDSSLLSSPLPDQSLLRADRPGSLYAFTILARRRWLDLIRDRMKVRVQLLRYLFFAIVLGLLFLQMGTGEADVQNREGALFYICMQGVFMTFMSNLNTFGPERAVVSREVQSSMYTVGPYFVSRWICEVPFRIVFPAVYATILYWMIWAESGTKYGIFLATLILLDNAGATMSIMICAMFPDVQQAMQAGPAILMPLMIFSGYYIRLGDIGWWFRWISYISPIRYGFLSVLENEMSGLTFSCPSSGPCPVKTGEQALEALGSDSEPPDGIEIAILVGLTAGFLIIAYSLMKRTMRSR